MLEERVETLCLSGMLRGAARSGGDGCGMFRGQRP